MNMVMIGYNMNHILEKNSVYTKTSIYVIVRMDRQGFYAI